MAGTWVGMSFQAERPGGANVGRGESILHFGSGRPLVQYRVHEGELYSWEISLEKCVV